MKLVVCLFTLLLLALALASVCAGASTKKLCKKANGMWTKETKLTNCDANVDGCRGLGCWCRPMMDYGPAEPVQATHAQLKAGATCVDGNAAGWVHKKPAAAAPKKARGTKKQCKKANGEWAKHTKLTNCDASVGGCLGLGCWCRPMMDYGPAEPVLASAAQLKAGAKCVDGDARGWVNANNNDDDDDDASVTVDAAADDVAATVDDSAAAKDVEALTTLCVKKGGKMVDGACKCARAYRTRGVVATLDALKQFTGYCPKDTSDVYTRRRANCVRGGGRFLALRGKTLVTDIFYADSRLRHKATDMHGVSRNFAVISRAKTSGLTLGCQCDPLSSAYLLSSAADADDFRCPGASKSFDKTSAAMVKKCKSAGGNVVHKHYYKECRCPANLVLFKDTWIYASELSKGMTCTHRCISARQWLHTSGGGKVPKLFRGC